MASGRSCCVTAHTHCRLSVKQAAQWEVPAKRAVIVPVGELLLSAEIYSCLKQPAFFLLSRLHHGHANQVLKVRQKHKNRLFPLRVVAWPWTALHAEVMTTQSAGISLAWTQGQAGGFKPILNIKVAAIWSHIFCVGHSEYFFLECRAQICSYQSGPEPLKH